MPKVAAVGWLGAVAAIPGVVVPLRILAWAATALEAALAVGGSGKAGAATVGVIGRGAVAAAAVAGHHSGGGGGLGRRHDVGSGRGAGNGLQRGCGAGHGGRYVACSDAEVLGGEDGAGGANGIGPVTITRPWLSAAMAGSYWSRLRWLLITNSSPLG